MSAALEVLRAAQEGDRDACQQAVIENNGLIWSVVRRYYGRGVEPDDLYQLGCLGFLKAVQGFDFNYGTCFSTYAVPKIAGEIRRFLRDDGMIKVSRTLKETAYKVKKAREEIINRTGIEPKLEELSELLEIDVEEIVASLEVNVEVESIHKTIYQNDGNAVYLIDKLASEKDENESLLNQMVIEGLLKGLNDMEQTIIKLRYFENKTQTEIAKEVGISQVQVSRMEKKILLKMRESYYRHDI